jgi:hypothetical protein
MGHEVDEQAGEHRCLAVRAVQGVEGVGGVLRGVSVASHATALLLAMPLRVEVLEASEMYQVHC